MLLPDNKLLHLFPVIRPGGGPAGYLYNLKAALDARAETAVQVVALRTSNDRELLIASSGLKARAVAALGKAPAPIANLALVGKAFFDGVSQLSPEWSTAIDQAGGVVVHDFRLFDQFLRWREGAPSRPIGVLMLHSPTNPSTEMVKLRPSAMLGGPLLAAAHRRWRKIEFRAIVGADALLVPNRYALDSYFADAPEMRAVLESKVFLELPSGVPALVPTRSRAEVRHELGLAEGDRAVGFLGRMVEDKGYDRFVEMADAAAANPAYASLKFLSAGVGPLMTANPPPNLIQLGWRSDVADLVDAFDIIVVPNRAAYFDLVILEALSLGKTVYTTYVGGSKGLAPNAVRYLYDDRSQGTLARQFLASALSHLSDPEKIKCLYRENYSIQAFCDRHVRLSKDLRALLHAA